MKNACFSDTENWFAIVTLLLGLTNFDDQLSLTVREKKWNLDSMEVVVGRWVWREDIELSAKLFSY
jgi:hypothetical protein